VIKKIVSGGQTGADQAALDAAIATKTPHGGWVPEGRTTESGVLDEEYLMKELVGGGYSDRTEKNVIDSDGTVIISHGNLTGGSEYTMAMARKNGRPCLHIDLNNSSLLNAAKLVVSWITDNRIEILNVAGPRASKDNKIYGGAYSLIEAVLNMDERSG
jgi:hypothetical protein